MMWSLKHEKWFLTHRHNGSCHLTWPKSVFRTSDPSAQLFLQGDALIETRCTHCLKFSGRVAYPSNTHRQTVCLDTILSSDPQSDPQKELSRQRSRVRAPSSPPYIPIDLHGMGGNQRGCKRTQICALFVSFFPVNSAQYCLMQVVSLAFRLSIRPSFLLQPEKVK